MQWCWLWEGGYRAAVGEKGWAKWGMSGQLQCGVEEEEESRSGKRMLRESLKVRHVLFWH